MNFAALAAILVNIIAPIVIVASFGFVLARALDLDPRALSRLTLYLFSPALVFTSAYRSKLDSEYVEIAAFALLITLLMSTVTWLLIRVMRYDRLTSSAFALSVLFVNAGNYGLPLILFAFGEEAVARAVIFFTMSVILSQTLAIFIASRGSAPARAALLNIFKLPLIYAVAVGLVANIAGWTLPEPLMKSADLLTGAAIPAMLVILGVELARVRLSQDQIHIGLAALTKLAVAPVVAVALAAVMGMSGTTRAVCIVESSMPTAVTASIVAVEFRARPEFVTGAIFVSTLGSIISLTFLLWMLG